MPESAGRGVGASGLTPSTLTMGVVMSIGADSAPHMDADTKKLHELGYAQELRRRMSGFSNFAGSRSRSSRSCRAALTA